MTDVDLLEALRKIEFLKGFADEHLIKIESIAQVVEIPEGVVIFREGDPARDIFLIIDGRVSLEICSPSVGCRRIHTISQGELLGWSPVLGQPKFFATARTIAPTAAVKISGNQILALSEHDSRFGFEFMRKAAGALAKRLNAARIQMLDVYGPDPSGSVAE